MSWRSRSNGIFRTSKFVLSDHYDGADFCTTLVYDAYRGEENEMLFAHEQAEILQMEDVANNRETVWGDLEGFGRNFCAFLERMMEQKRFKDLLSAIRVNSTVQSQPSTFHVGMAITS
ncbi:MAG TPA: hypothetical protein VK828_10505 [Terriglobales bacterium]|nr:hypothetical protein [Terriglobales bacterium]